MGLDAEVFVALNKTLTEPQTRKKIIHLFLNLVTISSTLYECSLQL